MKSSLYKFFIILITLVLFFVPCYLCLHHYFAVDNIHTYKELLFLFINNNYWLSVFMFIGGYSIVATLPVPPTAVLTIMGGFLFDMPLSLLYCITGATIGGSISFFVSRYFVGNWLQNYYKHRLKELNTNIKHNGHWYMLSIRLLPFIPFSLTNLLIGLTNLRYSTFVWTTFIGIIPGCFVYVLAGHELRTASQLGDLLTPKLFIILSMLAALSLIPVILKRFKVIEKSW